MHLQEVILSATAPTTSASASPGTVYLHDIQTGTSLATFKQTSANPHCTAFVESDGQQGGLIFSSQPDKTIMNIYNFQKDQLMMKVVLPEKLSCIAVDRLGRFCAGGTHQGRIFLWELASGIMYNAWDAHYRTVSVLRFTHDGAALLSASADSGVSVWSVSRLLGDDLQHELPTPHCTLIDHTLPITDVLCGIGEFPRCRVLTSSMDHSVKLWDLSVTSTKLLSTFQYPKPIICIAWDNLERVIFAATQDGSIYQTNLFHRRDDKHGEIEAVGGAGSSDVIRVNESNRRLVTVGQEMSSMAISLTSTLLIVGTTSGQIHCYDIASHQLLRTITPNHTQSMSVTTVATILRPPDLVGHISFNTNEKDIVPVRSVVQLQRMRDAKARKAHEVMILPPPSHSSLTIMGGDYPPEEMLRDHAFFVHPAANGSTSNTAQSLQSRITVLEAEVAELKDQLGRAKGVNDMMWETVVKRVVDNASAAAKADHNEQTQMNVDGNDPEEVERSRKRGRTRQ